MSDNAKKLVAAGVVYWLLCAILFVLVQTGALAAIEASEAGSVVLLGIAGAAALPFIVLCVYLGQRATFRVMKSRGEDVIGVSASRFRVPFELLQRGIGKASQAERIFALICLSLLGVSVFLPALFMQGNDGELPFGILCLVYGNLVLATCVATGLVLSGEGPAKGEE